MKRKWMAMVLSMTMVVSLLAGCGTVGGKSEENTNNKSDTENLSDNQPASNGSDSDESKVYKIGICQQLEHQALDAATEGFRAALEEKLGKDKVEFDYQNAQGEQANCATIATKFVNDKTDLIMANATTALQACAAATADIPIIGTSVTDFAAAGVV